MKIFLIYFFHLCPSDRWLWILSILYPNSRWSHIIDAKRVGFIWISWYFPEKIFKHVSRVEHSIFYELLHWPAKTWIYFTPYVCTERIFEKYLIEIGRSHLYASFGTFWVKIGQLVETQWDFKLSEEFEIDVIFLRKQRFYLFHTFFKDQFGRKKC